ncbi:MAG: FMN-binding negative transcriptional regulator [Pyrinomonadaceae bacterium]
MYIPEHFEQPDPQVVRQLIAERPLGALVTMTSRGLDANHIPFIFHEKLGSPGLLHGHIARVNPLLTQVSRDVNAMVIFRGPDKFISPSWYPTKWETGKVVPTWNFAVVHMHGPLRFIDDTRWIRSHVEEMTNLHEASRPAPWKVTDAPADYIDQLLSALVGLELTVERVDAKWKASQNRSAEDRHGVVRGLMHEGTPAAVEMADLVRQEDRRIAIGAANEQQEEKR